MSAQDPNLGDLARKLEPLLGKKVSRKIRGLSAASRDTVIKKSTNALNRLLIDMTMDLLPHVAQRVDMKTSDLEARLKRVTLRPLPDVNGYVLSSDGRTFEIAVDLGLMMLLHNMSKVFASRMTTTREEPGISPENTIVVARKYMRAFCDKKMPAGGEFYFTQLSDEEVNLALLILHHAERFVIAHELGHVESILSKRRNDTIFGPYVSDILLKDTPELKISEPNLVRKWSDEIAADVIGIDILFLSEKEDALSRMWMYLGAEFFLIVLNMLEVFYKRYRNELLPQSHPPGLARVEVLRLLMKQGNPPEVLQAGEALEQLADWILAEV